MRETPALSVIIPAYNEAERLPLTLSILLGHDLLAPGPRAELIVVDDGSSDDTLTVAAAHLRSRENARAVRLPWHAGKGAAVRYGVARARGEIIVFMDADLATDLATIPQLLAELDENDLVIGSRVAPGAAVHGRSRLRAGMHHAFKDHARRLTGIEASDPQCGFKAFRADAAKTLFHLARVDGFGFDIEILLLAHKLGLRVGEVPVQWTAVRGSKVRVVRDPLTMARDVARLRFRHANRPGQRDFPST